MAERAELVILGGGLAGLSLASRLATSGYGKRVVIVEPRPHYHDDRSWSFWTPRGSPLAASATRTWDRWSFSRLDGAVVSQRANGWCYAYARSLDVYQTALRAMAARPNITLWQGTQASEVEARADGFAVQTNAGLLHARHVVDTRPPPPGRWSASTLFQSFAGREVRLPRPGFDDGQVELMTDMRCDSRGFVFSYVLPLSSTRALVEVTRFSTQPIGAPELSPDLDALAHARGWTGAEVLRSEAAVLPMGLPTLPGADRVRGVVSAGIGGGALRAASGYGFLRIQSWAQRCTESLLKDQPPQGHPAEPLLRRWMDGLFLQVLARDPRRSPEVFMRLATSVPGPAFVRFLSDQARWSDYARVVAALPPAPFLRALQAGRPHSRLTA